MAARVDHLVDLYKQFVGVFTVGDEAFDAAIGAKTAVDAAVSPNEAAEA